MDADLFLILIVLAITVPMSILGWYRRKEQQDLKAIEFKILAAENALEYQEDGTDYLYRLTRRDLLPGKRVQITNVVSRQHGAFVTRVFDASHVIGSGKSSRTEYLIGVAVDFEDVVLPRFDLDGANFFDGLTFFDDMVKVKNDALPDWLKHNYSLFYKRQSLPYDVINLFQGKEELRQFLGRTDFHLLAGGSKTVVYYCKGETQSTLDFYKTLESIGITIARLFDYSISSMSTDAISKEIRLLKEDLQG